jgi:hypothetical protein
MAGDREALQQYLRTKKTSWTCEAGQQGITLPQYMQSRGPQSLAEEFKSDQAFGPRRYARFYHQLTSKTPPTPLRPWVVTGTPR